MRTIDLAIAASLLLGFVLGYGIREFISRRRRDATRRKRTGDG